MLRMPLPLSDANHGARQLAQFGRIEFLALPAARQHQALGLQASRTMQNRDLEGFARELARIIQFFHLVRRPASLRRAPLKSQA